MTEPTGNRTNPFLRVLAVAGTLLMLLGAIVGFTAKADADRQQKVQEYASTLLGGSYDHAAVAAAYGGVWFGVGIAVVGVILLIIWVSIRAAKSP